MRVFGWISGILILIAGVAAGVYVFRAPLAELVAKRELARLGCERPELSIGVISAERVRIEQVSVGQGPTKLEIAEIDVRYNWRQLLDDRRVTSVAVSDGFIPVALREDGIEIVGCKLPDDRDTGSPASAGSTINVPADAIAIETVVVAIEGDNGSVDVDLSGTYDVETGAALDVSAKVVEFSARGLSIPSGEGSSSLDLSQQGLINLKAKFSGDVRSAYGSVNGLALALEGEGGSWREVLTSGREALQGKATLSVLNGEIPVDDSPPLASLFDQMGTADENEPLPPLTAIGALSVLVEDGAIAIEIDGSDEVSLAAGSGRRLSIKPVNAKPLYVQKGSEKQVALSADIVSSTLNGAIDLTAESLEKNAWNFVIDGGLVGPTFSGAAFEDIAFSLDGSAKNKKVEGEASLAGRIISADVGRLRITDAPVQGRVKVISDLSEQVLSVSAPANQCVLMPRAQFSLSGQDLEASVREATFCENEGSILTADWSDDVSINVAGRLSATRGTYRLGQTTITGLPPLVDLKAQYEPTIHRTDFSGIINGGRVVVNRILLASNAVGAFGGALIDDTMDIDLDLSSVRIAQARDVEQVAPVIARGAGRLSDNQFTFDYEVTTPDGATLGEGRGRHGVQSGMGEASFSSPSLIFTRGGLQPDKLAPSLTGIIGATEGSASVEAKVTWAGNGAPLVSSADIATDGITFRGPGVAVSQTTGLAGDISFRNLNPITSDGPQTVQIGRIDLNALILEGGEATFEFPGDDTLRVLKAEFPWFGGTIGAYESVASITGGSATTRLEASQVDLSQLLAYLEMDGLSGEGTVQGVLPLVIAEGKARIEGGVMTAVGPGVIRYTGTATDAAADANDQAKLAFSLLRNLQFDELRAEINGPLDGDITFNLLFEGRNEVDLDDPRVDGAIQSPVIYRIKIDAPLLTMINSARNSADPCFLLDAAREFRVQGTPVEGADAQTKSNLSSVLCAQ